ncbi:biotin-dependent carboxyltransferase family protein [Chitinophaga sp. Mgbs1]|uniref:Biotin-dependent carboxyltransferase family protein n=1 Tax=Chitinophaga solisilvae TaxID=1233460 RepID=A0A3S1CS53_9BACT|nr:biotin-dependent carboxyltransferase family protein [Chitinophaga solisilvae]
MSITVIQQGISDTIQDTGRYGYQHLGINPGGAMDRIAMAVANSLTGNSAGEAVIELHFPAGRYLFETAAIIALSGADFGAAVNNIPVPVNKPVYVPAAATLSFTRLHAGARCYLAVRHGFALTPWLGSCSTHLKVAMGGFAGRALHKGDRIALNNTQLLLPGAQLKILPWTAGTQSLYNHAAIRILPGSCWQLPDEASRQQLLTGSFRIAQHSDRMGFRLNGPAMHTLRKEEQLSAGVCRGAIQLLPDGQLIILMADHQTTGGYPLIAHIITADIPALAQRQPGQSIQFSAVTGETAEELLWQQEKQLRYLQHACRLRLEKWLLQYEAHRS